MATTKRTFLRVIIIVLVLLLIGGGGLLLAIHQSVVAKANASYGRYVPVSARLSRFKSSEGHGFSIFWKLRFAKQSTQTPSVAVWRTRPFGTVDFEGAKR